MVTALLITGDTYTSRREIKALGGKWNPEEGGWLVPVSDSARQLAETKGFVVSEVEIDPVLLERPTGERLRAIRQAKIDRRAEQRLARAERLEREAEKATESIKPYMNLEFLTEPIKTDHHSAKRHRRLRERISNSIDKKFTLLAEAERLRKLAQPQKARIAGDAARRDQAIREEKDQVITVGSRVNDVVFGQGEVVRVNKKSYTVRWDGGSTFSRDKIYLKPL